MPTGKGYADIVLIPRPMHMDKPAAVIELKKNKNAEGAIAQIKQKNYVKALEDYKGNLLLVGINYDGDKNHTCVIEKLELFWLRQTILSLTVSIIALLFRSLYAWNNLRLQINNLASDIKVIFKTAVAVLKGKNK